MKRPFTFLGTYGDGAGAFPTLNGTLYDYWQSDSGEQIPEEGCD